MTSVYSLTHTHCGSSLLVRMRATSWGGLSWLVPSVVLSMIEALLDGWVLLVEIKR